MVTGLEKEDLGSFANMYSVNFYGSFFSVATGSMRLLRRCLLRCNDPCTLLSWKHKVSLLSNVIKRRRAKSEERGDGKKKSLNKFVRRGFCFDIGVYFSTITNNESENAIFSRHQHLITAKLELQRTRTNWHVLTFEYMYNGNLIVGYRRPQEIPFALDKQKAL